jgi:uncharacterized membrane protein
MDFDLWTFFVSQLFGGFWLAVFGIALLLIIILAVFGKLNKMTVINYLLIYFMCMTIGYGYRWITALLGMAIIVSFYLSWKNAYT